MGCRPITQRSRLNLHTFKHHVSWVCTWWSSTSVQLHGRMFWLAEQTIKSLKVVVYVGESQRRGGRSFRGQQVVVIEAVCQVGCLVEC